MSDTGMDAGRNHALSQIAAELKEIKQVLQQLVALLREKQQTKS